MATATQPNPVTNSTALNPPPKNDSQLAPAPTQAVPPSQPVTIPAFVKYFNIALGAFQMADQLGVGQPGQTKLQIAMKLVDTGAVVAAAVAPEYAPIIALGEQTVPLFEALFTAIHHMKKAETAALPTPSAASMGTAMAQVQAK